MMTKLFKKISEMWGLDLRSLALFRIAAAICLIGDFKMRSSDLVAHYTDLGVLPRHILTEFFAGRWSVSLHLLSGTWQVQAVLFGVSIMLALMLLVGYRTRLAVFFSWLLLVSVQMRNPVVLQGGDVLFRMILFWSLFLPLGACYSVDSAMAKEPLPKNKTVFSVATAAFILQIAFVYWFTAYLKMSGSSKTVWWDQGAAVFNALSIDQFTRPFGQYLLNFPELLKVFNYATILNEMFGPLLFFMPFATAFFRMFSVAAFISMHTSFAVCMLIGPFSWIGSIAMLPLLPGVFWDKLQARQLQYKGRLSAVYYDQDCGFCKKMVMLLKTFCFLPEDSVRPAQDDAAVFDLMKTKNSWVVTDSQNRKHFEFEAFLLVARQNFLFRPFVWILSVPILKSIGTFIYQSISHNRGGEGLTSGLHFRPVKIRLSLAGNLLAAAALAFVFCWNFGSVHSKFAVPFKWQGWGLVLSLDQYWNMFSPPLLDDGWYVIPGKLRDGTEVDIFKNGAPVDFSKPEHVYKTYKNTRWRKYLMNIWMASNEKHRLYYGQYLCRDWNSRHPQNKLLDTFEIVFMREMTRPLMSSVARKVVVWRHYCFKVPELPGATQGPVMKKT